MRLSVSKLLRKTATIVANVAVASALVLTSSIYVLQPQAVGASNTNCKTQDSYPTTNIIYCGLTGSDGTSLKNSFQSYYNANNDGHGHTDLKQVYTSSYSGFTGKFATSMFTSGTWKKGTAHNNGTITVNNTVVATNLQISSRCFSGMSNCQPTSKYRHLTSNVYTRDAKWFFSKDGSSATALVHFNAQGVADFATEAVCGNQLYFKPVVPQKSLQCVQLSPNQIDSLDYTFTAKAAAKNVVIDTYNFDFGNGKTQSVSGSTNNVNILIVTSSQQTYSQTAAQQTITIKVTVTSKNNTVSGSTCQTDIIIPPKTEKPVLVCSGLWGTPENQSHTKWTFKANASVSNTTADSFTFNFGDGSTGTFNANKVNNTTYTATTNVHTYQPGTYTIRATVKGPLGSSSTNACVTHITISKTPVTGPADTLGIFAIASTLGIGLHQFFIRRKLAA